MTASSPRGSFSQAELAGDRVITRCITRPDVGARRYHPAMPSDLERLPVPVSPSAPGAGPAVAAELLRRVRRSCRWSAG